MTSVEKTTTDRELFISRLLPAPRQLVWEVFTKPEHIQFWWGPDGFANTFFSMNCVPGGEWYFIMHGPDGRDYKNKSVFTVVQEPERLEFDHISGPLFHAIITFEEQGKQTLLSWRMIFESADIRNRVVEEFGAEEGLHQNVDKLVSMLTRGYAADGFTMTRLLQGTPEQVYAAFTQPEKLAKWWGPDGFTVPVCRLNPVPGGEFYIEMKDYDGKIYPAAGTYTTLEPFRKIVLQIAPVDTKGSPVMQTINTIILEPHAQGILFTLQVTASDLQPEATPYIKGMTAGWCQTLNKLEEFFPA